MEFELWPWTGAHDGLHLTPICHIPCASPNHSVGLDHNSTSTSSRTYTSTSNANANANTEAAVRRPRHHTRIGAARLDGEESAGRRPRAENAPARKKVPLDAGELRRRLELLWAARDE